MFLLQISFSLLLLLLLLVLFTLFVGSALPDICTHGGQFSKSYTRKNQYRLPTTLRNHLVSGIVLYEREIRRSTSVNYRLLALQDAAVDFRLYRIPNTSVVLPLLTSRYRINLPCQRQVV